MSSRNMTRANDGTLLYLDELAQTIEYNGSGQIDYVQVVAGDSTYRQTMTYTGGKLTGVSEWVKQ